MEHYDFIIAGSGAAGMLTAYFMIRDPYFDSKSILIIDRDVKNQNDRTWCYWEKGQGYLDH
ncbi:MAG: lycopene cyclase, partial [Saprospiraceae bacterium]|nr:lycopene cyclase [Saprospiraceae bacterium]